MQFLRDKWIELVTLLVLLVGGAAIITTVVFVRDIRNAGDTAPTPTPGALAVLEPVPAEEVQNAELMFYNGMYFACVETTLRIFAENPETPQDAAMQVGVTQWCRQMVDSALEGGAYYSSQGGTLPPPAYNPALDQ